MQILFLSPIYTYRPQTRAFFDRLITPPNPANARLYDNLVGSLVDAGIWAVLDFFMIYAANDRGTSLIDAVQSLYLNTIDNNTGIPTFTASAGWTGGYAPLGCDVNTNFNPSTAAGHFTQNNALLFLWQIGGIAASSTLVTDATNTSQVTLNPLYSGSANTRWAINGDGTLILTANTGTGAGFWAMQRTASNACSLFLNGNQIATSTNASASLTNNNLVGAVGTATTGNTIAALGVGSSLNSTQHSALYAAIYSYLNALGAV